MDHRLASCIEPAQPISKSHNKHLEDTTPCKRLDKIFFVVITLSINATEVPFGSASEYKVNVQKMIK